MDTCTIFCCLIHLCHSSTVCVTNCNECLVNVCIQDTDINDNIMRKPDCSQNASYTCFDWLSSKGSTCVRMQTQVQVSDWCIPISHNKCLNISKPIVMWPIVIARHASFVIVHQQCICISFTSWINLLTKHTCWQNTPFLHKLDKPADKTHLFTQVG